ncbi:hypothetical protein VFPPC_05886 [Pochonia chlamydosporia 170]|uniref:DUF4048 domain-containing protein n=1 Tax=Pochonia chlamydosporia 170 TaxID=1380566 RepID=A0A179FH69_METCM|nr:hypothetical protein VFPPC_05886 [Pochonia chlamydosporia 170]OAQ64630.2 hypothetical protein VFPPC_05886 [Pochonia chlamydosporia 170]
MTAFLLSICALDRCLTLFDEYRHLNQGQILTALVPRAAPVRRRRAIVAQHRASSTPFSIQRRKHHVRHSSRHSLSKVTRRHLDMASHSEIRRRSSAADRAPIEPSVIGSAVCAATSTFAPAPEPALSSTPLTTTTATSTATPIATPIATPSHTGKINKHRSLDGSTMPPPPLPTDKMAPSPSTKRHSRTDSSSRIPNRLSLTLPIALPTSDPSRPTPSTTSATPSSMPPTPQQHSALPSPSNVNEFIVTIAAKERKVLELREALAREEAELAALKKKFSSVDAFHKQEISYHDSGSRNATPTGDGGVHSPRYSVDMDRRSLLLQNQSTPTQNRRAAFRGRHARTLSLLSPVRTNSEFSVLEDKNGDESHPSPLLDRRASQAGNPTLAKRASWQPRTQQNSPVVPQLVEDFKLGFRAFVEDIRQITIGDEPVHGQTGSQGHHRAGSMSQAGPSDQPKSRNSYIAPRTSSPLGASPSVTAPPTPVGNQKEATLEKPRPAKNKHFSWTPLGFDSMDDTDWANWESPVPVKSTRWSGSTVHSGVMDDIQSIPENEEHTTPVKPKNVDTPILSPNKLEEILPNVVNRLSPSNIKRTANSLLDEWEKSLVAPTSSEQANKENSTATATTV